VVKFRQLYIYILEYVSYCGVAAVVYILVTVLVWQVITPGTKFRYWQCSLGNKPPLSVAHFRYNPPIYLQVIKQLIP